MSKAFVSYYGSVLAAERGLYGQNLQFDLFLLHPLIRFSYKKNIHTM